MNGNKRTVAIVDNDVSLLKAVERLVNAFGYQAETHTSAEAYLLRTGPSVDCLMLDINLDGISGLELQKRLLERGGAPPMIIISGRGDVDTVAQAADVACVAYLHKPFASHILQYALSHAMNSRGKV